MKNTYIIIIGVILAVFICLNVQAQENQEFTLPLSNPNQAGELRVNVHKGSVKVTGYAGKEIIVTVITPEQTEKEYPARRDGLRRIPNTSAQFSIEENANKVTIQSSHKKRMDFEIKVPTKFSLFINTHHDGYIEVKNVSGEMELDGHHNDIVANNVSGSIIADTHHGKIEVTFVAITPDTPMAFSTYHGDIDITFPSNTNGSTKIKTANGEIYTDFDLQLKTQAVANADQKGSKGTKIKVDGWMIGTIGTKGPEFMFSSYHGDVIIRKK